MTRSLKDFHKSEDEMQLYEALSSRSGRSENELMEELESLTRQERAAGRLDNSVMEELYEKLSPMLTERQREKMREVLFRLRG